MARQPKQQPSLTKWTIEVEGGGVKETFTVEDRSWYNAKVRARREFGVNHPHVETLLTRKLGAEHVAQA